MKNEMTHDDIINKEIEEEHEFMRARIKELENKPTYPFNEAFNKQLQEENTKLKQECKNLKEELRGCRIGIKNISIENTEICKISEKYKRALDEIENYVRDNSDFDKSDKLTSNTGAYDILEIINKAKDGE